MINMKILGFSLVMAIGFALNGCSGDGDSDSTETATTNTGVFIDSAVEGLEFRSSSGLTGETNSNGEFQFRDGDTIEFFVGNVSIGSMQANEFLSVFNTQYPSKVAMLLQSLDTDANPDNGIIIDSNTKALFQNTTLTIEEVSSEDESFQIKFKEITGNDFVVTEFDTLKHAESSLALEMLKDREFYNYYIGDINVYSNPAVYNNIELARSSSKRMNLYYFSFAILPQLEAQSMIYQYNIDSITDRHAENEKLVVMANDMIAEVLATPEKLSNPILINIDNLEEIYTIKDLSKELTPIVHDSIIEAVLPDAMVDAKSKMKEGGIIPDAVIELAFRELELIEACQDYFKKGGAAECYNALGTAALGTLNDGYAAWELSGEVVELNTNTIVQAYLHEYFNFAGDESKLFDEYGATDIYGVLDAMKNPTYEYDSLENIKNKITNYKIKVFSGANNLIRKYNLNFNMSTGVNTNLDVSILDGNTKLFDNGDGTGTISTCYEVKNNSFYQVTTNSIILSVIPKDSTETILSTTADYEFAKMNSEHLCVENLQIDFSLYSEITANPYVLKLTISHDGKTTTDSKVLESSLQNDIYDLIVAATAPFIDIHIPSNIYVGNTTTLDASNTHSLIDADTISHQWEFISTDKISGLVLSDDTTSQMTFTAPTIPDGNINLELVFKLTATSDTNMLSSSKEVVINVLLNSIPIANTQNLTVEQNSTNNTITLTGSDADHDTLTYEIVTNPTNGTLSGTVPNLTYAPTIDYVGDDSFTFKVNNGTDDSEVATVSITINEVSTVTYGTVTSPYTGRIWLDRNLGASKVCIAIDDTECYGDYYQWGRNTDGHEKMTSNTTNVQAQDINNAGTSFITDDGTYDFDWAKSADSSGSLRSANWSKTDGTSICPNGYRVPTTIEMSDETTNASTPLNNSNDMYNSFLKLPSAGYHGNNGGPSNIGVEGNLWTTGVTGVFSNNLGFNVDSSHVADHMRANGFSVRCIQAE